MARPLRLEFDGAFYHVTSRGNSRHNIYFEQVDYQQFLDILGKVCQRHNWRIHAYCLMTNHYHLLVETPEGNLSAGMQQLNGVYTQHVNRRYQRCGHIFQGRFKSILVDTDVYYKALVRYVLQNPLRAEMVEQLADYDWSSYQATIGKDPAPEWLVVNDVLAHFSSDSANATAAFDTFCQQADETCIWGKLTNQVFLGDEAFTKKQLAKLPGIEATTDIPQAQRRPSALPLENYQQQYTNRNDAILAAHLSGAFSMTQLAKYFKVHVSTVSKLVAKFKA
ncbi:MAG: addiction module toxin RelE [Rheinheimera sp.]|uniref:REP-associated tyrosine transposase n=1 Tax=Arsukibacterium sp. UBA3155 TaxID=1946058 RepID=UPI000C8B8A8F|nr:transposase [Arsukibacterium sp. UBA3155]MAD76363.1 addiction module toxin RelE [Rheinheimera sp.]|tara:strand:+ start:130124 stop:130960 length:837 start_codon:yes stop_codon:yes gene_type:complete